MNITTSSRFTQPALIGGAVVGVLSALPIVNMGNVCCCLWVVGGGAVAAYVLQQNQSTPITPGDGALAGLLAGLAGAFIYLVLSIPITLVMAPMERVMMERVIESGRMPPEFREFAGTYAGGAHRADPGIHLPACAPGPFSRRSAVSSARRFSRSRCRLERSTASPDRSKVTRAGLKTCATPEVKDLRYKQGCYQQSWRGTSVLLSGGCTRLHRAARRVM